MGWKIGDKPLVDPKDTDNILVEQDGKTSRTTWAKVKTFFLGTTPLTTNDKTITGAIQELKGNVDFNTAQLSELTNKIVDTGWIPLTLNSGLTVGQTCQVRRIGKIIFIEGALKGVSANNTALLTLPSGFRTTSKTLITRFTSGIGEISTSSSGILTYSASKVGTITANDNLEINLSFIAYDV